MVILARWTALHAGVFCLANAALYVLPLYAIPPRIRKLPRDNVTHIKYRMSFVSVSTLLSVLSFYLVVPYEEYLQSSAASVLGLTSQHLLRSLLITALLMTIFYLGPLVSWIHYILICRTSTVLPTGTLVLRTDKPSLMGYAWSEVVPILVSNFTSTYQGSELNTWINLRGLLFAPITEEIVFRSVMVPALHIALVSGPSTIQQVASVVGLEYSSDSVLYTAWMVVCVNPLCFGVAHVHHLIEKINTGMRPINAIVQTLVQFTYTSIFGVIATLLFMRTGSIYAAILSHIVCNSVGLPDIDFMVSTNSRDSSHYSCLYAYRFVHLVTHGLGLVLFACMILPLTEIVAVDSIYWK